MLEKSILGHVMLFPNKFETLIEKNIQDKHFLEKSSKEIFNKINTMYVENGIIEAFALNLDPFIIEELLELGSNVINIDISLKELEKNYKASTLEIYLKRVLNSEKDIDTKINDITKIVDNITSNDTQKNKVFTAKDLLNKWFDESGKNEINGIRTPFENLNNYMNFEASELIIIGARPSMGKTAFGLEVAKEVAKQHHALYVNLEMSEKQIIERMLASEMNVPLKKVKNHDLDSQESFYMSQAIEQISNMKLSILDVTDTNYNLIKHRIKKTHEKEELKIVVIDYLTLMKCDGFINKNLEVEHIANDLKMLAKELNITIIALAQLSRQVEQRGDKRPVLSDLRDSGGIEQAANTVMFLYRDDYYKETEERKDVSMLEVLIRKNRGGEIGTCYFAYRLSTQRIKPANFIGGK